MHWCLNSKLNWKDISSQARGSSALVGGFSQAGQEKHQIINLFVASAKTYSVPAFCGEMVGRVNKERIPLATQGHKSEYELRSEIVDFKSESIKEEENKSDDPLLKNPCC